MLLNILLLGLIFSILSMGIYLSFRTLNFPDLSADGSFTLGAAVGGTALALGFSPMTCLLLSLIGGALSGLVTAALNHYLKLSDLLSGILVTLGLYSVNLRIMGKPNLPLLGLSHPFKGDGVLLKLALLVIVVKLALDYFLKTRTGLLLKATGDNPKFVESLGQNIGFYKCLGMMLSSGLVALSGCLMAFTQGFADISMGIGIMVSGIASVILGEQLLGRFKFVGATSIAIVGSLLYRAVVRLTFGLGIPSGDVKLMTAALIVMVLSPTLKISVLKKPPAFSRPTRKETSDYADLPKHPQKLY